MDLSSIMTIDFDDDGLGENEFKKVKEKKLADLSKFELDEDLNDAARNVILMKTGTSIQIVCALSSLTRISLTEILAESKRSPAQSQELLSHNWSNDVRELFDVAVSLVADPDTDDDIVRRAIVSAVSVAESMAMHPAKLGETNHEAVGRVSTQFMRLLLAVLNGPKGCGGEHTPPKSPSQSSDVGKPSDLHMTQSCFDLAVYALPKVIEFVPRENVLNVAVPMCQMMAGVSRSDISRRIASEIIGAVVRANILEGDEFENLFLPLVLQLCQDVSADVRKAMSKQLCHVICSLSEPSLVDRVLPDVLELLDDEKEKVRFSMLTTAIDLIDTFPKDFFARKILPKFVEMVQLSANGENYPRSLQKKYGLMFYSTFSKPEYWESLQAMSSDMDIFLNGYAKLSSSSDEKIRNACCYNYPAMLKTVGNSNFSEQILRSMLLQFVADSAASVRKTVALFLHELCSILTIPQVCSDIFQVFKTLLQDTEDAVRSSLFININVVLNVFLRLDDIEVQTKMYQQLLPLISLCIKVDHRAWRSQVVIISQIETFPTYFNHNALVRSLIPKLMSILESSNIPVQKVACKVLCSVARQCKGTRCHEDMMRRFDSKFSCSESCTSRKTYLLVCEELMKTHSARFSREIFLSMVVAMLDDLVTDVQNRALQLLPEILRILRPKTDAILRRLLLERLNIMAHSNIMNVSACAKMIHARVDMMEGNPNRKSQQSRDKTLEQEEVELGYFKGQAADTIIQQSVEKLRRANKKLSISQKVVQGGYASSSDDDQDSTVIVEGASKLNRVKQPRKKHAKKEAIKPEPIPRHSNILPMLNNKNLAPSSNTAMPNNNMKAKNLNNKRRPPGFAKLGKSPRSGKNLRSKPPGAKKKKKKNS